MRPLLVVLLACAITSAAGARQTGVLRISVVIVDLDGGAVPVPRAQLLISDNPSSREPWRVRTGADGSAEITLPAGSYTVESDVPVALGGRSFSWIETLDVPAGRETLLELTAANAAVDAADAAAGPAPAAVTHADGAVVLGRWQRSLAEIWTPARHATGFVVDARGLIATSDRALGEATDVEVEFGDAASRLKVAGRVVATDRTRGVTLVWVNPSVVAGRPPIAPACGDGAPPPIAHDDRVVALIAPMLELKAALPGSAIRPDAQSFRADWRIDSASAGGPVFAAGGSAIGITVGDDEAGTTRRSHDSYVIPLSNACGVIVAAASTIAGAAAPPDNPRRTEAGLPRARPARIGDASKPRIMPPVIRAADYDIALMTPAMAAGDRSMTSTRSYFGYWSSYVDKAPQVLLVRVSPQFEESFWRMLARGAASTQGVSLPPMPSFSAAFGRLRALCGEVEIAPIQRLRVDIPIDDRSPLREAVYVFARSDFGPHCGTVRFELFSEKSPDRGDMRTIDPAIFSKLVDDSQ